MTEQLSIPDRSLTTVVGIELKASEAIFAVVGVSSVDTFAHLERKPARLKLEDGDSQALVKIYSSQLQALLEEIGASTVYLRKRGKKGPYAGGAETFRIEGLLQMVAPVPVVYVTPQRIAALNKKQPLDPPASIAKFQANAWLAAVAGHLSR